MRTVEELRQKVRVEIARKLFTTIRNREEEGSPGLKKIDKTWFDNWPTMVRKEKV